MNVDRRLHKNRSILRAPRGEETMRAQNYLEVVENLSHFSVVVARTSRAKTRKGLTDPFL